MESDTSTSSDEPQDEAELEEELDEHDGKHKAIGATYDDVELGQLEVGPDGMPKSVPPPDPVPEATPANMICLRGPCRHYWELDAHFESGNPRDTWTSLRDPETGELVRKPRQVLRTCLAHPGTETDLTEGCVFECSKWDPMDEIELKQLLKRRTKYIKQHPELELGKPIERR